MPYIKFEDRLKFQGFKGALENSNIKTAGEFNYLLTLMVQKYLGENPDYQRYNDVVGAVEGAKMELYRRMVAPYEDTKIEENGDVY